MESRVNYALVGVFVIVLTLALAAATLWLTVGAETKSYYPYRVYFSESVAGLNPQSAVTYRGVDVGQVASINLDPDNPERVEIRLDIETIAPVREDTQAKLVTQGLTGLAYVELTGGSRDSQSLVPTDDNPVPTIDTGPSLIQRLEDAFTSFTVQLDTITGRLDQLLSDDNIASIGTTLENLAAVSESLSGEGSLNQTLANLQTITAAVASRTDTVGNALDNAAATFEASARIGEQVQPLLAQINAGVEAVQSMATSITETSAGLSTAVEQSRRDVLKLAANTTPELNSLLSQLGRLADTLQGFVDELERNPRMLLLGRPSGRPGPGE